MSPATGDTQVYGAKQRDGESEDLWEEEKESDMQSTRDEEDNKNCSCVNNVN